MKKLSKCFYIQLTFVYAFLTTSLDCFARHEIRYGACSLSNSSDSEPNEKQLGLPSSIFSYRYFLTKKQFLNNRLCVTEQDTYHDHYKWEGTRINYQPSWGLSLGPIANFSILFGPAFRYEKYNYTEYPNGLNSDFPSEISLLGRAKGVELNLYMWNVFISMYIGTIDYMYNFTTKKSVGSSSDSRTIKGDAEFLLTLGLKL